MSDDSSSESDDEFLTVGKESQGAVDRDALIRKKLLESFYGQSAAGGASAAAAHPDRAASSSSTSKADGSQGGYKKQSSGGTLADAKDLDSPYFDAESHTTQHIVGSSVHGLLEMDEQLSLQVRNLDSTTQNMVYENYSKYILATEAIKNVGVNVQANEPGLERLMKGMEIINENSIAVEDELGTLRDAVAEKIRVKRLLTRLEALLKLPQTLREQIEAGKYRTAASSFCRSTNILSKHSDGFESLQNIQAECKKLLLSMMTDVKRKLCAWSGQDNLLESTSDDYNDSQQVSLSQGSFDSQEQDGEHDTLQDPPKSISEIFECAGALALLVKEKPADLDPGVTIAGCQEMSITASMRALDRLLDIHQLEVQEAAMDASGLISAVDDGPDFESDRPSVHLVPTLVVDGILETAALFRMSFKEEENDDNEPDRLEEFVREAFASFLSHVKSVLIEHSMGAQQYQDSQDGDHEAGGNDGFDGNEMDITGAMSTLLVSVRELASALSLPEIGVSPDTAAELVEQASDLSETLVRQRVDRMFIELRLRVVSDCLVPFADRIAAETKDAPVGSVDLAKMGQGVQILISDCMQTLEDTIRSIVSSREDLGASIDLPALKQSIQASAYRFASWLAGSLELLAGCDSSDEHFSFETSTPSTVPADNAGPESSGKALENAENDETAGLPGQYNALTAKISDAVQDLIAGLETVDVALQLVLVKSCKSFEVSFVETMQSIKMNVGGGKKGRSSGLFPMDDRKNVVLSQHEKSVASRFQLAGTRILTLYCTNRGFEAAQALCSALNAFASAGAEFPGGPSSGAVRALDIAKQTSIDSSNLFKEANRAGPMPDFSSSAAMSQSFGRNTSPIKGLQLDVERMFQEKVPVFPHPSDKLDLSRETAMTLMFRVAIKALEQQTRRCFFSSGVYTRLLVDVEFLREMIPYYVDESDNIQGLSSSLTDTLTNARDRCDDDEDIPGNEEIVRSARGVLGDFMNSVDHSFLLDGP